MPAVLKQSGEPEQMALPVKLGQQTPFPSVPLVRELERRWLHYAFLSRDNKLALVSNISWLGPAPEMPKARSRCMSILLIYRRGRGWRSGQFNTETLVPLWSSFRLPHRYKSPGPFELRATSGSPAVRLQLQRSSHPCTSQSAPFAVNQHFRWQSETGVLARGEWQFEDQVYRDVEAVGYHERVSGTWGWPELGGWVFGFANDPQPGLTGSAPPAAVVFTLIQPDQPPEAASASVMIWRNGRLIRHFPRKNISVVVRDELDRDAVCQVPELANLLSVPPMAPIPRLMVIRAQLGADWMVLEFQAEAAARIVNPNETGINPFSVHEVVGPCKIDGRIGTHTIAFETYGIVEFAGGAGGQ